VSVALVDEPLPAPDLASAIEAWRVWRVALVDGRAVLMSVFRDVAWPYAEPLEATCLPRAWFLPRVVWRRHCEEAPGERCRCGIYAAGLESIDPYLVELAHRRPHVGCVVGRVSLWGTVVACEHGFRASLAYPLRLYVPRGFRRPDFDDVLHDLSAYRVPVEPLRVGAVDAAYDLKLRGAA
jgi:hypothetical protein